MLEYFTIKKIKKHNAAEKERREHSPPHSPLLNDEDTHFLERIVSTEGTPPPLPQRPTLGPEAGDHRGNASQMVVHDGRRSSHHSERHQKGKGKGKEREREGGKPSSTRFSFLKRSGSKKNKKLNPDPLVSPGEAVDETSDLNRVLEDLNLSAINNRAFSLSKESQVLVQKFTVVLKDLINGVPTAYDDLTHLLDDSHGTLSKSYDHLPSFLQKLIQQLPEKMKGNLGPELLAVAAEAQALNGKGKGSKGGMAGIASQFLKPGSMNLKDLVAKPGAVVSLLKTIMNALKLRWPAFMGTNVLLSLGLFVLLFVFWYCHKRGREVRLEREAKLDSQGRVVELPDDPLLQDAAGPSSPRPRRRSHDGSRRDERRKDERRAHSDDEREGVRRKEPRERREMTSLELERDEARRREQRVHEKAEESIRRREREERGSRPTSSRQGSGDHRRRRRSDEEYASSGNVERRERR